MLRFTIFLLKRGDRNGKRSEELDTGRRGLLVVDW